MTLTDLKAAVLQELRVTAAGESAPPEDSQLVEAKYQALYDMLADEGLVSWARNDEIPAFAVAPMTWMLAYLCAPSFGVSPQRMAELRVLGALGVEPVSDGERILRRQLARGYVSQPVETEYF